jgi:hypothetical protein
VDEYGTLHYVLVDTVDYSDGSHPENFPEIGYDPWPAEADGSGKSLTRLDPDLYGNDVANWGANGPSPGGFQP